MERFTSWIPTMIDAGAKGALLLVAIFIVARVLRGASAATRHVAWAAGIVVLIGLPVLSALLPRFEVKVPMPTVEQIARPPAPASAPEAPEESAPGPRRAIFADNDAALPQAADLAARLVSGAPDPSPVADPPCPLVSRCTAVKVAAMSPAEGFVTLWFVIAAVLLGRLGLGAIAAHRLVRRSRPIADPSWLQLLRDGQEMVGVTGRVRLFESADVSMPVTLGVVRPTIVLPPVAMSWSEERRLAVLVHELAHVLRKDVLTCLTARIACALHWLNPLVWRAARKLRDECERACDDLVIRSGVRASSYADDLLDIVRSAGTSRSPAVALPMAQASDFEGRLLAILAPSARRRGPSRARSLAMAAFVAALAMPLAAMAPAPYEAVAPEESGTGDFDIDAVTDAGPESGAGVTKGVGSVLDDLGVDLGGLKQSVVDGVATGLETAKSVALDAVSEISVKLDEQFPQPTPTPDPDPDPQGHEVDERALSGLLIALSDADRSVRLAAAQGLGGLEDPRAVEALSRALLSDENVEVRRMAAWALGEIEDARAVPALSQALRSDKDDEVRKTSAWALGEIESATAVEALGAALKDSSPEVRKTAVWALGEIESPNAVPHLLPFLRDENAEIRAQAAWALGEIESAQAVEGLSTVISDREPKVREMAVWALGEIENATAVPALSKAITDENVGVRRKAAWALGELDLSEAPAGLIKATTDEDREVRKAAAHALGEIGDPAGVPALTALARGQDNAVRYIAINALAEIDEGAAVEVLVELLKDPDPEVRKIAARALGKR